MTPKMALRFLRLVTLSTAIVFDNSAAFRGYVYHGLVREDAMEGDNVELDSPLYVRRRNGLTSEEICGYTIFKAPISLPFKMVLLEPLTGSAKIVIADGGRLDYEKQQRYSFEISAHDCNFGSNMSRSERELVLVEVEDINDHRPEWVRSSFTADADEGRIYDRLLQLKAKDADGSDPFSRICHFHIVTKDVPFEADADGVIRNTEPLDFQLKQAHVFEVTAEDCGGLLSDVVTVTITVNPVCFPRWTGISSQVDFITGTHYLLLAANARLNTCDACNLTQLDVTVKFDTVHLEKECDLDSKSIKTQLKLCGASEKFFNLASVGDWTGNRSSSDETKDDVLDFDGFKDAIVIDAEKFQYNVGNKFTIVTWMKHSAEFDLTQDKEQILCYSDSRVLNHRQYSLFLHNCHLILLLRRQSDGNADSSRFQPTEWRWKVEEVCDGNWHLYTINFDLTEVRLYIDGKQFVETRHNPMIIDDWPLHPAKSSHSTRFAIGACWHGRNHELGEFFLGQLAGISILVNATETDHVIHCLHMCQERLDFTRLDDMETATSVSLNSAMSSITISGESVHAVQNLLRRVNYVNTRAKPTSGHRPLSISTNARCSDGEQLLVDTSNVLVTVVKIVKPVLLLRLPVANLLTDEDELKEGVKIFANISLVSLPSDGNYQNLSSVQMILESSEDGGDMDNQSKLESCLVQVDSHLDQSYEYFKFPSDLFSQLSLVVDISEDGIVISGSDVISSYQVALSSVEYLNTRPGDMNQRYFTIRCTEWTGQFISNQLDVTLEVVHKILKATVIPDALENEQFVHSVVQRLAKPTKPGSIVLNSRDIGLGMAIMIVLCVGTLIILTVLGALKLRSVYERPNDIGLDEKPEMEWDNSALTITVNPMEQEMYEEPADECSYQSNDTEESEEEITVQENGPEGSDAEEEGTEKVIKRDLEWDDSTLTY